MSYKLNMNELWVNHELIKSELVMIKKTKNEFKISYKLSMNELWVNYKLTN
jgi:hypothetical protein